MSRAAITRKEFVLLTHRQPTVLETLINNFPSETNMTSDAIVYCCEWSMDPILVRLDTPLEKQLPPKDVEILRAFYDEQKAKREAA